MDEQRANRALGGLILALVLAPGLASGLLPPPPAPAPPLEPPADAAVAAELGWPIASNESDPAVWSSLAGIGPARARGLAEAAARGELLGPDDLLRVPGFGIKMAAVVADRVAWPGAHTSSSTRSSGVKASQ